MHTEVTLFCFEGNTTLPRLVSLAQVVAGFDRRGHCNTCSLHIWFVQRQQHYPAVLQSIVICHRTIGASNLFRFIVYKYTSVNKP